MTSELPSVHLTPEALAMALKLRTENPSWHGLPLRVYIEGKGCDGFYYGVTFAQPADEDLSFTQTAEAGAIEIIVDPETFRYVRGSKVEWVDDSRGTGFLVVNPQHKRFRGKFYKSPHWQRVLLKATDSVKP